MRVSFTFRNLDSSDAIKDYANEKVGKLQKLLRAPIESEIVFSLERHHQRVDVTVHAGGHRYAAHDEQEDMYAAIDLAMDKIDHQIRKEKGAETQKKRSGALSPKE